MLDGERRHHHRVAKGKAHRFIGVDLLLGEAPKETGRDRIAGAGWIGRRINGQRGKVNVLAMAVQRCAFRPLLDDQPAEREPMP